MEKIIKELIEKLDAGININPDKLNSIIRFHNRGLKDQSKHHAKKYLLPFFLEQKNGDTDIYKNWNLNESTEAKLLNILKVKPKRSASGVATITVITKPQKCGGNCIFCPNDIRMPKSYLSNEPACQRAERNYFDPYLQVLTRLKALYEMGHNTDKVEMIILGGTWNDYTPEYQKWFIHEVFRALNNGVLSLNKKNDFKNREQQYITAGISNDLKVLEENAQHIQEKINNLELNYNNAFDEYYDKNSSWENVKSWQKASWDDVFTQHKINENSKHRCVGLVVETRPAVIDINNLTIMRKLGCTKVQIGVQSLDSSKMDASERHTEAKTIQNAFALLRLFGFKIHAHFMANLPGATPESDKTDFEKLVKNPAFLPDEIKLYPCMLVESARLNKLAKNGKWSAYNENDLVEVLVDDVIKTPAYTRISRMMRDISSNDITQGVKKTNLRQMVEQTAEKLAKENNIDIQEIRHREINLDKTNIENFKFNDYIYQTNVSEEHFLQFVTTDNKILGFSRLSLPKSESRNIYSDLPTNQDEAMIREVHVYGKVANIGDNATNAQHLGLGKKLISHACKIAKTAGFTKINVISAIGTRQYYIARGFDHYSDNNLYQQKNL